MSHDITARYLSGDEIAYLSIGAFNNLRQTYLYGSLQVQHLNRGVSGSGKEVYFSRDNISESLNLLHKFYFEGDEPVNKKASEIQDQFMSAILGAFGGTREINVVSSESDKDEEYEAVKGFFESLLNCGDHIFIINFS